ncbi:MAG: FHA domain-containing protein, partial [Candidatus Hydrogenedentes bacterium]|nr:FHA domain-containing protein [Candidatus Hydrogenedentota bacterium]
MAKFEFVLRHEGAPSERFEITARGLSIGRNADNDIMLEDGLVSRRHARLWYDHETLLIEDLGSRNGVQVNGASVKQSELHHGDEVQIGPALFRVVRVTDSQLGRTVISAENAASLYQSMVSDTQSPRLPVLYRAAQLLGSVFDLDVLLAQILALIFEALPVRRGFIMLRPPRGNAEPKIHASLSKETADEGPPLSHTLIQHVFTTKEAMLTLDAQLDSRFDHAASIVGHGIHSAMCAPLCGREAVEGAIYVDSGTQPHAFVKDDLELLTTIARVVGMAVENARLYKENVQRERLAAIGEATAGVGHCVKNILTGIRGGGEFIGMALEKNELRYVEKGWPILKRSIQRIEDLVMNMLSFS